MFTMIFPDRSALIGAKIVEPRQSGEKLFRGYITKFYQINPSHDTVETEPLDFLVESSQNQACVWCCISATEMHQKHV